MSFQTRETSVYLQNTVYDILDLVRELSVPPLKLCVWYTVHVQKGKKNIIKVVHVTSEGQLEYFEASKIHFGPKITNIMTYHALGLL